MKKHKLNCQCMICKAKRGEFKSKGNPFYNKKHSNKTKEKIRKRALKRFKNPKNHPCFGKRHTKETIIKMKKSHKGKIISEVTKKKMKNCKPLHHIDGNHFNKSPDNLIKLNSKSIHQKMLFFYYKFIKLKKLDVMFKKWLNKNFKVKEVIK